MFYATRKCPECKSDVIHSSMQGQKYADKVASVAIKEKRLCLSCARSGDRNPSKLLHVRKLRSEFFKKNNPSKGKPAWNRGIPHANETKEKLKISRSKIDTSGENNPNWGNFKYSKEEMENLHRYTQRVRLLTERVVHLIPGFDKNKRGRTKNDWHVDHIRSITSCFKHNIPIEDCAALDNLQFITCKENMSKRKW